VTRQIVTSVIPILAVLVVYGRELLGLFGEPYVAGYAPSSSTSAGVRRRRQRGGRDRLAPDDDRPPVRPDGARLAARRPQRRLNVRIRGPVWARRRRARHLARDRGAKRDSGHPVAPLRGAVAVRPHLPHPAGGRRRDVPRDASNSGGCPGRAAVVVGAAGARVYAGTLHVLGVDPETGSSHESLRGGTVGPSPSGSVGKLRANRWSATGYASESARSRSR